MTRFPSTVVQEHAVPGALRDPGHRRRSRTASHARSGTSAPARARKTRGVPRCGRPPRGTARGGGRRLRRFRCAASGARPAWAPLRRSRSPVEEGEQGEEHWPRAQRQHDADDTATREHRAACEPATQRSRPAPLPLLVSAIGAAEPTRAERRWLRIGIAVVGVLLLAQLVGGVVRTAVHPPGLPRSSGCRRA